MVDLNEWCWYCVHRIKHSARDHEHERERHKAEENIMRQIEKENKK